MESSAHPRVAVNGISSFNWDVGRDIELCQQLGVSALGVTHFKLLRDGFEGVDVVRSSGLQCSSFVAGTSGNPLVKDPAISPSDALPALRESIDLAASLGTQWCYFTSGPVPDGVGNAESFDVLCEALGPAVAYAEAKGVTLAIEPNSTATRDNGFIHTLNDAVDLCRATGIAIDLELQNCWVERNVERLIREHIELIAVVQVSDFKVGEEARLNRAVPGDGDIPLERLLGTVLDAGYEGLFEIEMLGPRIEQEGYAAAIERGVNWLSERLAAWGV